MSGVTASLRSRVDRTVEWIGGAVSDAVEWLWGALVDAVHGVGAAIGAVVGAVGASVGWLFGAIVWLGRSKEPVGEILAVIWPYVVAAILLIALLRSTRWLLLVWRGRTPRVQISSFAWTGAEEGAREATWVTSLFREQLAELRLDALDPLPERAPGAPLVEIVEGVGQGVARGLDVGKAAGRLFRAVWPDSAYEVWGTLRPRESREGPGGRISVQLVERRGGNRTLLNVALEGAEWRDGARQAAMAVAGALYPRVRAHDRGPWTMWEETVPRELMDAYHTARKHEEANRLEQALDSYHAALDQDPLNPNLRLKIAMLQERLELNLDAWVTYEAIVDESDPRAWRGPNRRIYMLAHYRLAILLGNGRVAEQWVKNDSGPESEETKRDRERSKLRKELRLSLGESFAKAERWFDFWAFGFANASSGALLTTLWKADREVKEPVMTLELFEPGGKFNTQWEGAGDSPKREHQRDPEDEDRRRKKRLEERETRQQKIGAVLQVLSLRHLEQLDAWLRVRPPERVEQWRDWWIHRPAVRKWMKRREFSRSAIRVSKLLVRLRIAASLELRYRETRGSESDEITKIREDHRTLSTHWPFPPTGHWRRLTDPIEPRRFWANRRDDAWQLHYNAACAVASALCDDSVLRCATSEGKEGEALAGEMKRTDVVVQAVKELEEYAYRAGSQRVAAQADWLAIDDPDFEGLRLEPRFTLWASHHLPRNLPPEEPSRKSDVRRFTLRVIRDGARALASSWRERADNLDVPAEEIAIWWRRERRAWEMLQISCREHLSWGERLKGLNALQAWLEDSGRPEQIDFGYDSRGDMAGVEALEDDVFDALAELAGDSGPASGNGTGSGSEAAQSTVLAWVNERAEQVRIAYEDGEARADANGVLLADVEREEALKAFRIWTWLADALTAELHRTSSGEKTETSVRDRLGRIHRQLASDPSQSTPPRGAVGKAASFLAGKAKMLKDRLEAVL